MTRSKSNLTIDLNTKCFICEKQRDKKGKRKLNLISTSNRENLVLKKAEEVNETRMTDILRSLGTDMISNSIRYHKMCMDAFMNRRVKKQKPDMPMSEEDGSFHAAFMWLVSVIEPKLLLEGCVYFFLNYVTCSVRD